MEILAKRLRFLREQRNLTQADVAKEIGIATFTYQRYEYGEREPSAPLIVAIADFYGVSTDYLLGRSEER